MKLRLHNFFPTQRSRIEVDEKELLNPLELEAMGASVVSLHLFGVSGDPEVPRDLHALLRAQGDATHQKKKHVQKRDHASQTNAALHPLQAWQS